MKKLLLLGAFYFSLPVSAAPEIWLLSGKDCNVCDIFEEASNRRNYGNSLTVKNIKYPIQHINKASLPKFLSEALKKESINLKYWDIQLTVAVVDNNKLFYQGNIADSVDFNNGIINQEYMRPKEKVTLEELHDYGFNYTDFFKQQFNLEYFVNVAVNGHTPNNHDLKLDLSSTSVVPSSNISLWGSAHQPANNGLFIATRINQLLNKFKGQVPSVIFGHGANSKELDTLRLKGEQYTFIKAPVKADYSADKAGLESWLSAIKNSDDKNHLIIQVGHSGPSGAPVWGHSLPVNQSLLQKKIKQTNKETILVSGACHSGLFARAASCGFYAAHPDAIATGCQKSLSAIDASDDYLKFFFESSGKQDLDGDNKITFTEAHWYASTKLENHNISYSDKDAIVDEYFLTNPDNLKKSISLRELRLFAKMLPNEERYAIDLMTGSFKSDHEIPLTGHVHQHKLAMEKLKGKTELSSSERNKITALGYPLSLVVLARRALHASQVRTDNHELNHCDNRVISEFIQEI